MREPTSEYIGQRGDSPKPTRFSAYIALAACTAVVLSASVLVALHAISIPGRSTRSLPAEQVPYLGVYEPGAPESYAGIDQFAQAVGRQPNIVLYYGAWLEPFQVGFASTAAEHGAKTLVQIGTGKTSLESIANGKYDSYWRSYADAVKAFGLPVILSIDHEMNGDWESWGYRHEPPTAFVAAWRHIVDIFRGQGAQNVTWLWTINIIDTQGNKVAPPRAWWPGKSYVNWVGIDGYYYVPSETFAPLFGPTIASVRELTNAPILIAETGAAISAGQSEKISDLFAGVSNFGLLGFVLFDENGIFKSTQTWRLAGSDAYAALRQGIKAYMKPS